MKNEKKEEIVSAIKYFLVDNEIQNDVEIFYNNQVERYNYESKKWEKKKNISPKDYMDYYNLDTITMSFEGELHTILNYEDEYGLSEEFVEMLEEFDVYYKQGNTWNLSIYCE